MSGYLARFKEKYQITNNWSVLLIIIAFAITGSSSVVVSNYVINVLASIIPLNGWLLFLMKILITTPIYMVLLIIIGSLLGQYTFFSLFLKHMVERIMGLFGRKKA